MPVYATLFLIMALSSIGLPLLNGFIGEFTILQGAFARNFWWAFFAATGHRPRRGLPALALPARLLRRDHEPGEREAAGPDAPRAADARSRSSSLALWIGLYPKPIFDVLRRPSEKIVQVGRAARRPSAGARPRAAGARRRAAAPGAARP